MKLIFALIAAFGIASISLANDYPTKVDGLELPDPQTVTSDEGFITVSAKCTGLVTWLILADNGKNPKYRAVGPNDIDLAVATPGNISIYAIGLIEGKNTPFTKTTITVKSSTPAPTPTPAPKPVATIEYPLHLNIIEDPSNKAPEVTAILSNTVFRDNLAAKKVVLRVYSTLTNHDLIVEKGFDTILKTYPLPVIIMQDNKGNALVIATLPKDTIELSKLISPYFSDK